MWPTPVRKPLAAARSASPARPGNKGNIGFTLLELLVSMAVVGVLMLILVQVTSSTGKLWRGTTDKIKSFQSARAAFDSITQTLAQATLNTYYEYFDSGGNTYTGQSSFTPAVYDRNSELHFVSAPASKLLAGVTRAGSGSYATSPGHAAFFQSPLGYTRDAASVNLDNTLNSVGYFVEFGSDQDFLPPFLSGKLTPRHRYRLMQLFQPAEEMSVYTENWAGRARGTKASWLAAPLARPLTGAGARPASILADNILYMVLRPKRSDKEYEAASPKPAPIAPDYTYDSRPKPIITPGEAKGYPSRHQLPPIVSVTLVAIDETSAARLEARFGSTPPLEGLGLADLFQETKDTNVPADYEADLNTLKDTLTDNHINFRIFETDVMLRSSKWTKD